MSGLQEEPKNRCLICNAPTEAGQKLCECCLESFALCDLENLLAHKVPTKNCTEKAVNAFK